MTASQFIEKVQAYFGGKYNDVQKDVVTRWATRHAGAALDKVFASLAERQDWRGALPLVGKMHQRLEEFGMAGTGARPVPEQKPQQCKECGNEYLEDNHEVMLCRQCLSMWVWMDYGRWQFAPSQQVILRRAGKKSRLEKVTSK